MKLKKMNHLHSWMSDPDAQKKAFHDLLGFSVEERDFTPYGYSSWSSITGNGRDKVWVEFIGETKPHSMPYYTHPRKPHIIAIDYQVEDLDQATAELKEKGFEIVGGEVALGSTRQIFYSLFDGFYLELSEFEGDDILAELGIEQIPCYRTSDLVQNDIGIIKFDHVTGWNDNVEIAERIFKDAFGFETSIVKDDENKIKIAHFNAPGDDVYWELIQKLDSRSLEYVDGWDTAGLFSLGYQVEDLDRAVRYLEANGVKKVWESYRNGKKHVMFSAEKTYGINIELCE